MRAQAAISSVIAAIFLAGCGRSPIPRKVPIQFEIANLKRDTETQTYGTSLKFKGVMRVRDDALKGTAVMLLVESKASFKTSGITKENKQDAILIKDGSGLIETSFFFTPDEVRSIGPELSSAAVSWTPVGYIDLQPASIEVR